EERFSGYGDSAYVPAFGVMGPFGEQVNKPLTEELEAVYVVMAGQRTVVEWEFGFVVNCWALNFFKRQLSLGLSPIADYYIVATLLTDILLCITGRNQVSEKHDMSPPTIEEYLYISDTG
ncbi:hypothetical protein HOY82DRAFT_495422, partial [Tuber indicum]